LTRAHSRPYKMIMPIVRIPTSEIHDWSSFHDVFARVLGFPGFYGRNMNAWIDCLSFPDLDDGMVNVVVGDGAVLTLQLDDASSFAARCPGQYAAVIECAAFVNWRRIERKDDPLRPILALAFYM
jgi:hypothetical protein